MTSQKINLIIQRVRKTEDIVLDTRQDKVKGRWKEETMRKREDRKEESDIESV